MADYMSIPKTIQHPASADAYMRHGWALVPIPYGTKGPTRRGWNQREAMLTTAAAIAPGMGIGLAHAYSGTMTVDVDEWDRATRELQIHGIDLQALYDAPDAVVIDSGRPGHGKLLYAMPFGLVLPSKKLVDKRVDDASGKVKSYNYLDLRCGTANGLTVQDVLPPTIHPDTQQPYRWAGRGHWSRLPTIPPALLTLWNTLLEADRSRSISTSEAVNTSWEEIRQALEYISPDCSREEWINTGMALHWAGVQTGQLDAALYLWDEWSQGSESKYPGQRDMMTQWASFREDKQNSVKLGTLFHLAKRGGWVRQLPDASHYFSSTEGEPVAPATPTQVSTSLRPPPPDLDFNLLPGTLTTRSLEVSDSVGCDPLVPLFAGLGAICGVVDARTRLELMPGYKVPPVLWLMTIGDPADKKSPGSRPMLSVLKDLELEDRPRFKKEFLDWEAREASYAAAKKAFLEHAANATTNLSNSPGPVVPDLPPQPVPVKITVSDITSQKLVRSAADRPRGLLCYLDEMNAWVKKVTDRNSGEDRSAWVSSYEAEAYEMDRVGSGSIHAENLAVAIFGNIQPVVFRQAMAAMATDGLLQRFVPAILRSDKTRLGHPIPDFLTHQRQWDNTVRTVFALPPMTYRLSTEAFNEFRTFQAWYEKAKQRERLLRSGDVFMTAFGKIEGLAGRLILVMHLIENPFNPQVDAALVQRVVQMIRRYVIPSLRYAFDGELGGVSSFDQWIADHIIRIADQPNTTLSDIKRSARRQLDGMSVWDQDAKIYQSMWLLEQANWVKRIDDRSGESKHYAAWAINPHLSVVFREHREAVIKARQDQLDDYYSDPEKAPNRVLAYGYDPETME